MLQVPRRVEYALRAVILLAQKRESGPQSFRDVASELDIPSEFLAKILRSLVRSGIVRSKRGAAGGYELARPADEVSFLDVIEAAESPIALNLCTEHGDGCAMTASCTMSAVWQAGERAMLDVFRRTMISDLICAPFNLMALGEAPRLTP